MSTNTVPVTVIDDAPPRAAHGQLAYPARANSVRPLWVMAGLLAKIYTIVVSTYTASAKYEWEIGGVADSYTESGDTNANGVAAKIFAKINANPMSRRTGLATVATDTVTFTGTTKGNDFEVKSSDSKLTVTKTQDAAYASDVAVGVVLLKNGKDGDKRLGKPVDVSALTAKAITVTYGSGTVQVAVRYNGQLYEGTGANAAALKTDLDANLPANAINVTVSTNDVTLTAATKGATFELVGLTGAITLGAIVNGDDILNHIAGLTTLGHLIAGTAYPGGGGLDVCEGGAPGDVVWLEFPSGETPPAVGGQVFLGTSGAEAGLLYTQLAAGRIPLPWTFDDADGSLGAVRVTR